VDAAVDHPDQGYLVFTRLGRFQKYRNPAPAGGSVFGDVRYSLSVRIVVA